MQDSVNIEIIVQKILKLCRIYVKFCKEENDSASSEILNELTYNIPTLFSTIENLTSDDRNELLERLKDECDSDDSTTDKEILNTMITSIGTLYCKKGRRKNKSLEN